MNILITGRDSLAARLAACFMKQGHSATLLTPSKHTWHLPANVPNLIGDIRSSAKVAAACEGRDLVVHTWLCQAPWAPSRQYFEVNMRGTANLLQACIRAKVRQLIHVSDAGVVFNGENPIADGDESLPYPPTPIGPCPASLAHAERMVLDANGWEMVLKAPGLHSPGDIVDTEIRRLATCVLRPSLLWGQGIEGTAACEIASSLHRPPAPIPANSRSAVTHADRLVEAVAAAARQPESDSVIAGKTYFVADAEPVNVAAWLTAMIQKAGGQPPRICRTVKTAWYLAYLSEIMRRLLPHFPHPRRSRYDLIKLGISHTFNLKNAKRDLNL